jgi:predicted RND superfamily exporter protein
MLRRRRIIIALIALTVIGSVALLTRLRFMHGMEDFYDRDHPQQRILDALGDEFVGDRWVFVAYEVDDTFSTRNLAMARQLSERLLMLSVGKTNDDDLDTPPAIEDVVGLTTVQDAYGGNSTFRSAPLVPDPIPTSKADLDRIRARAEQNPVIWRNFVGAGGRVGGMAIRLASRDRLDDADRKIIVDRMRAELATVRKEHGEVDFYLTGLPIIETDIPHLALRDTLVNAALMFAVVALIVFAALRRLRGLFLTLGIVSVASLVGLAMIPATGGTYNPISSLLLPILAALCVATIMHFLVEAGTESRLRPGEDVRRHVFIEVMRPAVFTIITTAIGFASLGLSKTRSVSIFGWATAAALLVGGLITLGLIALAFTRRPVRDYVSRRGLAVDHRSGSMLERFADVVIRRRYAIVIVGIGVVVLAAIGATRIRVGESNVDYFTAEQPVRRGAMKMDKHLGGSNSYTVSIRAEEPGTFLEPANLAKLDALAQTLRTQGYATRVTGITDFLRIMNRAFHGEKEAYRRLPETRQQVAQLLMMNTSDRVNEYIDTDRRWARIYVRTPVHDTGKLAGAFSRVEKRMAELFPAGAGFESHVTGNSRIFALNFGYVTSTQTTSLFICALVILVLMSVMFRSVSVALFTLVPNAMPIIVIFGVMGWFGLELSISTAMIGAVTLGIAVDDTIHFVQQYRNSLSEHGDIERAVRETFRVKGSAIIWSSLIFSTSFLVFLSADFTPFHLFAALSSLAMAAAVVGDLVFLPALLLVTRSRLGAALPGATRIEPQSGTDLVLATEPRAPQTGA